MHCPYCGKEVKEDWIYCPNCAKNISTGEKANGESKEEIVSLIQQETLSLPEKPKEAKPNPAKFFAFIGMAVLIIYFIFQAVSTDRSNMYSSPAKPTAASTAVSSTQSTARSLSIQEGWTWKVDGYGFSKINGNVKNTGTAPIGYFNIRAEYLDDNGNVLDTAFTNSLERINPGDQKRFEIMHRHSDSFKKARLIVEKVQSL